MRQKLSVRALSPVLRSQIKMLAIATIAPASYAMRAPLANLKMQEAVTPEEPAPFNGLTFAKSLPGITGPLDFFDPAGFCSQEDVTEGKIRFYREVELKHCRVAMLAALGFPVAEQFHPLFATDDAPSFSAFQQTSLQSFFPLVVFSLAIFEVFSVFTFEKPSIQTWSIDAKTHPVPGDFGWDPLGLKPTNEAELKEMQTKELNNGRLAMIAIAGMVVQEGVTGGKLF